MSLRHELTEIFYRHDPVGLAELGAPEDEYLPEVEGLLPRLREAISHEQLRQIIHSVFLQKFGAGQTCGLRVRLRCGFAGDLDQGLRPLNYCAVTSGGRGRSLCGG